MLFSKVTELILSFASVFALVVLYFSTLMNSPLHFLLHSVLALAVSFVNDTELVQTFLKLLSFVSLIFSTLLNWSCLTLRFCICCVNF